ncbi:disease resistance protein RUN1-like isoform X2 [Daucus carota subsp. sativus]|uniref:disease resistance protein RUN1-like isoform X2 n=1 Tax=Daucus carota subsp. sativus TaxID=79200 RepID=UPI003082BBE2
MAFVLWETLKESISAYADLSPVTLVIFVALGLALFYAIWVMFGPSARPHQQVSVVEDKNEVTTTQLAAVTSSPPWDVFLSFRGEDTRTKFSAHLYHALDQAGIVTFRDDPALPKGEEISTGLRQAIRNSKMFVVVISENYADSSWCLDELVQILSCKRTKNQVIPVFYYVNPSDLRRHTGSFGVALKKHKKRHSVDKIDKWKSALTEIAALSGYHLEEAKKSEADTIQNIVDNVLSQASTKVVHLERGLFGIDSAVEDIYQRLSMESNDVRALGICGMGGIGKTTIAKAFYNKYAHEFDASCFLENIKQNSQGASPLLSLLQKLLKELLRAKDFEVRDVKSALRKLGEILSYKKALVVFDDLDMDHSSYSDLLARICELISDGGRMIITSRDLNLPNQLKVKMSMSKVDTYRVKHLNKINSLELFSYHAFKQSKPPGKYLALSKSFVTYAGGLPLALKVLGSSLCGRTDVSFWKVKLKKVQKIPMENIQSILQLSYDELEDDTQKTIFLDIVLFFLGKKIDEANDVFRSCEFFPECGIPVLVERCLLIIDYDNRLQMHNLIQDMGRNIIHEESKHGECRHLYLEEASQALPNQLPSLRHLNLKGCKNLKELPHSIGRLTALSHLNLNDCVSLKRLPNPITQLTTLSSLNMRKCSNLKLLPEQLGDLKCLKMLDVSFTAIEQLPDSIAHLKKLVYLDLSCCTKLRNLPEQFGNMEALETFDAEASGIEQLPDSFSNLLKLRSLNLRYCSELKRLPEQVGKMQCLERLDASSSAIEELPDSIGSLPMIKELDFNKCEKLSCVPNSIGNLKSLRSLLLVGEDIIKIELIEAVTDIKLETLHLSCNIRVWLPIIVSVTSLTFLILYDECGSPSPTKPFSFFQLFNLKYLQLTNSTTHGSSFPELPLNLRSLQVENHASLEQVPELSYLKHLFKLSITRCCSLQSLHKLPPHLESLTVKDCTSLQEFPDLSMLRDLEQLDVYRNGSNLKVSLEENHLQLGRGYNKAFRATLQNREIAEWFDYKNREGCTLSFHVPPNLGDNFVGVALWVVYKCSPDRWSRVEAVITNKTEDTIAAPITIGFNYDIKDEVQSSIHCIRAEDISIKNGDKIMISFPQAEIEVNMCGAHIIKQPSSIVK